VEDLFSLKEVVSGVLISTSISPFFLLFLSFFFCFLLFPILLQAWIKFGLIVLIF